MVASAAAPAALAGVGAASIYALAYMARGPAEQIARGARRRPWDVPALSFYALAIVALGLALGTANALVAALVVTTALAIPVAGVLARRARVHRSFLVEAAGMAACGASTGLSVSAGGVPAWPALAIGVAMASYALAAVPIVRCETRRRGARRLSALAWLGLITLAAGAGGTALLAPRLLPAFAPRAGHALVRAVWGYPSLSIHAVAVRESVELALFVVLLVVLF